MSNAAIQFHPDGYDTSAKLMGRQSAGESFLRGFLQHGKVDRFKLWNWGALPLGQLHPIVERVNPASRPVDWLARGDVAGIADVGCLFMPSPANPSEAWNRRVIGSTRYSLCGITHTTASAGIMDAVGNLLIAPVEPWDALICTSKAVEASVNRQLAGMAEYLKERLAPGTWPKIRLETIPLGVNSADFVRDEGHRNHWRQRLGIDDDALMVLYVGRFSFHGKMNPVPMAMAMERAARTTDRPVHWVWSGWAGNEHVDAVVRRLVADHAPSVRSHFLDGRQPDVRFPIWSAADVFFSLSDNIQETFGLTPVEAMAARLPSVISDWDGYRDTVRHELDGFRVPTWAPRPGLGTDLAMQHANQWMSYDHYIGNASQFTAVDIEAASAALSRLFADPELRERMGRAAEVRAREVFDWSAIIPRYQALWAELQQIRKSSSSKGPGGLNPLRPDPFALYAGYPTRPTEGDTLVTLAEGVTADSAVALLSEPHISYSAPVLPRPAEIVALITRMAEVGTLTVSDLIVDFPLHRRGLIERGITFLAKYGCVTLAPLPPVQKG